MPGPDCDKNGLEKNSLKFSKFRTYIPSGQNYKDLTLVKTGLVDDSTTTKRIDAHATNDPGGRTRPLLRFLTIGMLILGIFWIAPIAMASDTDTDTDTHTGLMDAEAGGLIPQAVPDGSSLTVILAEPKSPDGGCTAHTVGCYDKSGYFIGTAGSGCSFSYSKWTCDSVPAWDAQSCREKYKDRFFYAKSWTPCYWESS